MVYRDSHLITVNDCFRDRNDRQKAWRSLVARSRLAVSQGGPLRPSSACWPWLCVTGRWHRFWLRVHQHDFNFAGSERDIQGLIKANLELCREDAPHFLSIDIRTPAAQFSDAAQDFLKQGTPRFPWSWTPAGTMPGGLSTFALVFHPTFVEGIETIRSLSSCPSTCSELGNLNGRRRSIEAERKASCPAFWGSTSSLPAETWSRYRSKQC